MNKEEKIINKEEKIRILEKAYDLDNNNYMKKFKDQTNIWVPLMRLLVTISITLIVGLLTYGEDLFPSCVYFFVIFLLFLCMMFAILDIIFLSFNINIDIKFLKKRVEEKWKLIEEYYIDGKWCEKSFKEVIRRPEKFPDKFEDWPGNLSLIFLLLAIICILLPTIWDIFLQKYFMYLLVFALSVLINQILCLLLHRSSAHS